MASYGSSAKQCHFDAMSILWKEDHEALELVVKHCFKLNWNIQLRTFSCQLVPSILLHKHVQPCGK